MINPTDVVRVKDQCSKVLNDSSLELNIDARSTLESFIIAADNVLNLTSHGRVPVVPPPTKPAGNRVLTRFQKP